MATPSTAARSGSPWTAVPARALGTWALAAAAVLLVGCGQGGTGAGGTTTVAGPGAPDVASTTLPPPSAGAPDPGETMDPSTPPDPSVPAAPSVPAEPSGPGGPVVPPAAGLPADPAGADLVLVAGPPGAEQPPVTLVCDWAAGTASGTHPQAAQACADLLAAVTAGDPFAPVSPDAMCTQQYGGDAVVQVTGALLGPDGAPVDLAATYTLTDGCQISRFDAMGAVLAPFRGSV